jgi:hypothetical protein
MKEQYLNPELKAYYMDDFTNNVLPCMNTSWNLDSNLSEILKEINKNVNVQTLYSQKPDRAKMVNMESSYIRFTYTKSIEKKLFRNVIPEFLQCFTDDEIYYTYDLPRENSNYSDVDKFKELGCIHNPDYFRVNFITINFSSYIYQKHDEFWEMIKNELSIIGNG